MGNRLGLDRGVHHHPLQIPGRQGAGLVSDRQALLQQRHQLLLAQPLAPSVIDERSKGSSWQKLCSPQKYW